MHEDSRPVTIPSVDSTVHEFNLSSTYYLIPPLEPRHRSWRTLPNPIDASGVAYAKCMGDGPLSVTIA